MISNPALPCLQPTPVLLSGESHGQRSLVGSIPQGHKESDVTEAIQQASKHCPVSCLSFTMFLDGAPHSCCLLPSPVWLIPHPHSTTSTKDGHTTRANGQFSVPLLLGHCLPFETSACFYGSTPSRYSISCISSFAHSSFTSHPLNTGFQQTSILQPSSPHWLQGLSSSPNGQ